MKKRPSNQFTGASVPAILVTACLVGSSAFAADYFHLGGADGSRIPNADQYSNTNGSATVATFAPGSADDLFFYNSLVAGSSDQRLELGASNRLFNSLTFVSNAGTTQIDRGTTASTAGNILGLNGGGITVASGAGPVTFGRLADSGNNQRVIVGVYQDLTVANHSTNDLTFNREFDGRGTAQRTVTVAGSGDGDTIFKQILSYDTARDLAMTINKTSGSGVVRFDGTNNYRGNTTVTAGTLVIGASGSTGTLSAVTVSNSGSALVVDGTINGTLNANVSTALSGSGTVEGAATVAGILNPGTVGAGLLRFNTTLAMSNNTATTMEILGLNRGTDYDAINVGTALTYDGSLTLALGTTFGAGSHTFNLFDLVNSPTGSFDSVELTGSYTGTLSNTGGVWTTTTNLDNESWSFDQVTGDLSLTVIPEPSAALMGGLGMLFLLRRRRA